MPKISENVGDLKPATLKWLAQIGCRHVVFQGTDQVDREKRGYWLRAEVEDARRQCEQAGMTLESMMLPHGFYRKAMLGQPGRDAEIENVCRSVRAASEGGVKLLEWRFKPDFFWGDSVGYYTAEGRGGAKLKAFDYSRVANAGPLEEVPPASFEEMWSRFRYFAKPVLEEAGRAGVRMTMHPTDPPVPSMRGVAHIFHHPDNFRRMLAEFPTAACGVTFCQGTITEMGVDVAAEIRHFGGRNRLYHVHFRNVKGKVPRYVESFIDEGDMDMLEAMRAYKAVNYIGPIVSDHTPKIDGDIGFGWVGRSYSHGYMRALIHAVNRM
jgi:mannonate dehydratase